MLTLSFSPTESSRVLELTLWGSLHASATNSVFNVGVVGSFDLLSIKATKKSVRTIPNTCLHLKEREMGMELNLGQILTVKRYVIHVISCKVWSNWQSEAKELNYMYNMFEQKS
jgi:hypothetical protein